MASGTESPKGLTFNNYSIKNGAFNQYGKGVPDGTSFTYISGEHDRIQLFDDPGNSAYNVKPYLGIRVSLRDGDTIETFKIKLASPIGVSFAKRLHHVEKGDLVKLSLTTGSKNANASFISLRALDADSGEWVLPEPAEWSKGSTEGMSEEDKIDFDIKRFKNAKEVIVNHSAFYVPEEKTEDEPAVPAPKAKATTPKKAPAAGDDFDPFADE
jgi:hypothetical protein